MTLLAERSCPFTPYLGLLNIGANRKSLRFGILSYNVWDEIYIGELLLVK